MAGSALNVSSLGIQVTGQNLANVNTPGYAREQLILETSNTLKYGRNVIGTGVQASGVVQIVDQYLEERLRNAVSDTADSGTQYRYTNELEALVGEFSENDLSTSLDTFFNSIANILNNPETVSYRKMAVEEGGALAEKIRKISGSLTTMRHSINKSVGDAAEEINLLTEQIRQLNMGIAKLESGRSPGTEATSLRDDRQLALTALSQIVNIKVSEDADSGAVTVSCGGDILVAGTYREEVYVNHETDSRGLTKAMLVTGSLKSNLNLSAGAVAGMYEARDTILGGFAAELDYFTHRMIESFNAIYTSGQGLDGYSTLTSLQGLDDPDAVLGTVGFDYPIQNGSFSLFVTDAKTKVSKEESVTVEVKDVEKVDPFSLKTPKPAEGTTLNDLIDRINGIEHLSAELTSRNELKITSDSPDVTFAFGKDTSGLLAAMGINTFFTGTGSADVGVHSMLETDPAKFAASSDGIGKDTLNAVKLAAMPETPSARFDNMTITGYYRLIIDKTAIAGGTVKAIATADASYQSTLQSHRDAVSGVNPDDETINLLVYQRAYQATSKYVTAINEMLDYLLQI